MVLANWAVSATAGFILGLLFDNFRDAKQFLRLVDKIPNRFKYKPVMKVKHKIKWLMKFGNWKPKD